MKNDEANERRARSEGILSHAFSDPTHAYTIRSFMERPALTFKDAGEPLFGWPAGPAGGEPLVFVRRPFISSDDLWHFGLFNRDAGLPFLTSKRAAATRHELMADETPISAKED